MPDNNGNTITAAGDANMGGYQKLKQPKRGVGNRMFHADGGGKELSSAGVSTGHGGSLAKTEKNVKARGTESPKERIDKMSRTKKRY